MQLLSDNPSSSDRALDRLTCAQAYLPDGYQLQIKEGWRPIWVQERLWEKSLHELRVAGLTSPTTI